MKHINNKYGKEIRLYISSNVYILNLHGQIGDETSNYDLWRTGYKIGFTPISKYLKKLGLYLFVAVK